MISTMAFFLLSEMNRLVGSFSLYVWERVGDSVAVFTPATTRGGLGTDERKFSERWPSLKSVSGLWFGRQWFLPSE